MMTGSTTVVTDWKRLSTVVWDWFLCSVGRFRSWDSMDMELDSLLFLDVSNKSIYVVRDVT